jgi:hypothetical protein
LDDRRADYFGPIRACHEKMSIATRGTWPNDRFG